MKIFTASAIKVVRNASIQICALSRNNMVIFFSCFVLNLQDKLKSAILNLAEEYLKHLQVSNTSLMTESFP